IVAAHGCDEPRQQEIAAFVSRGIISEAIATGETVVTANASADLRFKELESVQRHKLEAVLCVPIGRDVPIGIVYLQGTRDGEGAYTCDERVQRGVELVARTLALPIERLLVRGGAAPTTLSPRLATEGGAPADDPFGAVLGKAPAISETIAYLRLA